MSRCFPYPPPGYMRNDSRVVASIKSIELRREDEKAKSKLKKEKKRQRQERKKEKKESKKGKSFDVSDDAIKKLSGEKLCQVEKSRYDLNGRCISKGKEEAEQLERSSLTEEHGMPFSSQSICYLSDGTQSSKKRKASSSEGSHHRGNVVRLKLTLRKHKDPEAIVSGEWSCSTSGRADSHVQYEENTCPLDQKQWSCAKQSVAMMDKEKCCSGLVEVPGLDIRPKSYQTKMQKTESLYRDLIQEWLPPPIQLEQEGLDDQDWLFGVRRQNGNGSKRIAAGQDAAQCRSPILWPRARYLPEADVFALPFTVPF